jgi:hypothetical protein
MSMREKNQHAARVWKALPQDKRDCYLEASKQLKTPELSQLSEKQKEKLIHAHKKNVINEVPLYNFSAISYGTKDPIAP